jgi:hypothetical protein
MVGKGFRKSFERHRLMSKAIGSDAFGDCPGLGRPLRSRREHRIADVEHANAFDGSSVLEIGAGRRRFQLSNPLLSESSEAKDSSGGDKTKSNIRPPCGNAPTTLVAKAKRDWAQKNDACAQGDGTGRRNMERDAVASMSKVTPIDSRTAIAGERAYLICRSERRRNLNLRGA